MMNIRQLSHCRIPAKLCSGLQRKQLDSLNLHPGCFYAVQKAFMRAVYGDKYPYDPAPYPYELYSVKNPLNDIFFWYGSKHNENTRMLMVEGNLAVGKKDFAKALASGFDLKYLPPVNDADLYFNEERGLDMRSFNYCLPPKVRFFDLEDFYSNKFDPYLSYNLQYNFLKERTYQMSVAMKHAFCTGQGTAMARSVFSDIVFARAMYKCGYISKTCMDRFQYNYDNVVCKFWAPHLFIYLDAPLAIIKERIKKRGIPWEQNTPILSDKYLKAIEDEYKNYLLPRLSRKSEVMTLNWDEVPSADDTNFIIEEISKLELEAETNEDIRFIDWYHAKEESYQKTIHSMANRRAVSEWFDCFYDALEPRIMPEHADKLAIVNLEELNSLVRYRRDVAIQPSDKIDGVNKYIG